MQTGPGRLLARSARLNPSPSSPEDRATEPYEWKVGIQGKDQEAGKDGKQVKGGVIQSQPQPPNEESHCAQDILERLNGAIALGIAMGVGNESALSVS